MSHQTKRPFDSVECSTPHDLLIRCSLSNLQFPAIALTWCGLTSHRHIEPFFMSLAARDSEFRPWSGPVDRRICQTFAASPAEPGELPLGFSTGQFGTFATISAHSGRPGMSAFTESIGG